MLKYIRIACLLALTALATVPDAAAQHIVDMRIDTLRCIDDSLNISIGYNARRNVVVVPPNTSISHPQRTFLPDGTVCDSTLGSCTYRSPITFTSFDIGSVITSAQDIDFVRLNIEHSYNADLLIALECPNGQYASLMNPHLPPTDCCDSKFDSVYGRTGSNSNTAFMGIPVDQTAFIDPCDTNDIFNRPGIGWNYCWSENISHQYAPEDGLIYRTINVLGIIDYSDYPPRYIQTIDSTHIAENSQFYRPEQSFNALIGCPMNGTWNIVVQDSWGSDNGYIFDWELSLNPSMYVQPRISSTSIMESDSLAIHSNDSTLVLVPPASDTTIDYSLQIVLSSGDTIDTAFSVHWLEPYYETVTDTLCQGDTARWNDLSFTTDTLYLLRTTRVNGCDSIVDLSYTFMPTYDMHDTLPFCANEQFIYDGIDYGGPTTIVTPNQTQYGCDSTVSVHLIVVDSAFHLQLQMSADGEVWSNDTILHGCQPMTVWLRDTTLFEHWRLWTFGDGDTLYQDINSFQESTPFSHTYDSVGEYSLSLTAESIHGCVDSVVFRRSAVRVYATPKVDFYWSPEEVVSHDPWTQFVNRSTSAGSPSYLWHIPTGDGNTDTTSESAPIYRWPVGSSDVEVMLSAILTHQINDSLTLECIDSAVHTVIIINEYLQFPNLVTPNGDGVNDRWVVVNLLECGLYSMNELWIYDRWGALVYHVRDIRRLEDFWDPSGFPDGTYYYRFRARSRYGLVKRNGTIEVMR